MVRVAVRNVPGALFLQTMGGTGQIVPLYAPLGAEALVARATEGAELVVNATGLLSEHRKGDFNRVHVEGAGQIARLAASSGARQVVHLSAIGADAASPSAYGRSKAAGEAAVRAAFPAGRDPAPLDRVRRRGQFFQPFCGDGGSFLPVLPIVGGATKFQPVYVGDVAAAALAALSPQAAGKIFELGGPEVQHLQAADRDTAANDRAEAGRHRSAAWASPGSRRSFCSACRANCSPPTRSGC